MTLADPRTYHADILPVSNPTVTSDTLSFCTPTVRVRVTFGPTTDHHLRDAVATTFRSFTPAAPGAPSDLQIMIRPLDRGWWVESSAGPPAPVPTLSRLLSHLVSIINQTHVDLDPCAVHLHAGGVIDSNRAVLAVGPSGSGKSTLMLEFVRSGSAYLSDEALGVEIDGRVRGYPKPLTVKAGAWSLWPDLVEGDLPLDADIEEGHRWEVPPDAVGAVADPHRSFAPRVIVLPTWAPDLSTPLIAERLAPTRALLAMAECSFDLGRSPAAGLHALGALVARTEVYALRYRNADEVRIWLDDHAGRPDRPPLRLELIEASPAAGPEAPEGSGWLRRTAPSIMIEDRAVVFVPTSHRLMTLDRQASLLWARIDRRSARDLIDDAEGPPLAAAEFLASLTREGVVAGWTT